MSKFLKIDTSLLTAIEPVVEDFDIDEFLIDPFEIVPPPTPILAVKQSGYHIPIFTEDNISLLQGKAKSRKSTFIKAIGIAIACGNYDRLECFYPRNKIAIIDTEQGKYHCWQSANLISQKSGVRVNYYKVAGLSVDKKKYLVEEHLKRNPDCGFLILDNIVHFLNNFNDPTESALLNEWLIKMKSEYNCHILNVLHENGSDYGNGKAKGHIGTLLENTCETIIRVEKNKDNRNQSIVSVKESRGQEFEPFVLERDMQGIPFLYDYIPETKQGKI